MEDLSVARVIAPTAVSGFVTLQLNTQVGPFQAGSILVVTPQYGQWLVETVPQCLGLSRNIVPGAYVIVRQGFGCYPDYWY